MGEPALFGRRWRWKRAATGRRPVGGLWPKMENDGGGPRRHRKNDGGGPRRNWKNDGGGPCVENGGEGSCVENGGGGSFFAVDGGKKMAGGGERCGRRWRVVLCGRWWEENGRRWRTVRVAGRSSRSMVGRKWPEVENGAAGSCVENGGGGSFFSVSGGKKMAEDGEREGKNGGGEGLKLKSAKMNR
ncbi:protein RNA-directed DNA methylation 3-like [Alnus glutinosa]|uniref:protein RNA-directed DNA methylation 3-like n=1 Tax=Alnus glutinosa TaxID=3517 RepID=UPI002D767D3A|nr:protein RNA-directed DNA methylation 3-like [Alnus glutinosa]